MYKILLVDDDNLILGINKELLTWRGYDVSTATSLAEAGARLTSLTPDIIILDVLLPDGSGLDFLKELRQEKDIPVLLLSGLGSVEDRLEGLRAGGDDYLPKPHDSNELLLRIEAILHRAKSVPETINIGPLVLDMVSSSVFLHGTRLDVRNKAFDVLCFLMKNANKVFSADEIYERVWGRKALNDNRTIRAVMHDLRKDIEGSGYTISSEYGKGYCFMEE